MNGRYRDLAGWLLIFDDSNGHTHTERERENADYATAEGTM